MNRRKFLQTVGTVGPVTLAAPTSPSDVSAVQNRETGNARLREPKIFFFEDGRHATPLYQFEPPVTPSDFTVTVDQLASSGVDTYICAATLEGGVVQYDSRVAQKWGDNVDKWKHLVWYRASRVLHQLIADGYDPLKLLADRCHELNVLFLASSCVGLQGGDRATHGGLGRKSDFVYDHPQYQVGPDPDPRANNLPATRFSFLHPEVRYERFLIFEELLTRYETDGVEINLAEDDFPFPYCRFDEVDKLAPLMTEWIGKVRTAARKAEKQLGRRKRLYVRVPAHPDSWKLIGYEVPAWLSGKLVDGLICVTSDGEHMDQDLELEGVVRLARAHGCRVLASFSNTFARQLKKYATPPMIWAAAANAYAQGADGFGLGDAHWSPNGWPWSEDEYQTLRILGCPELLATADKFYHVRSEKGQGRTQFWLPGGSRPLPVALGRGEAAEVPLRIADDLPHWHSLGRIKSVRLRLRFTNLQPSADRVQVELNHALLPESILEKIDLTYRLLDVGAAASPYGYAFEYHLTPEFYPRPVRNVVKVTLLERDSKLDVPFEFYDVDCAVEYRLHRHFEKHPIEY